MHETIKNVKKRINTRINQLLYTQSKNNKRAQNFVPRGNHEQVEKLCNEL